MTQSTTTRSAPPLPSPKERRRLREARALSESQVAEVLGVTRATVRSWETGRASPRGRKREAYVKLLNAAPPKSTQKTAPKGPKGRPRPRAKTPQGPAPAPAPAPDTQEQAPQAPEDAPSAGSADTGDSGGNGDVIERTGSSGSAESNEGSAEGDAESSPESRTEAAQETAPQDTEGTTSTTGTPAPNATVGPSAAPGPRKPGRPETATDAFDALYTCVAPALVQQAYLLTGRRRLAREAVEYAFHRAWECWPQVAVDRDPAGWVRAAAHEYALSPWHRLRPSHRHPDPPTTERAAQALRGAVLDLPPPHRRALLLYDGLGIDLPETAAELEASTPAAAGRVMHARAAVTERLPELTDPAALHERLAELLARGPTMVLATARTVRTGSERRARFLTRAAIALTTVIVGATAFTLSTAPTRYEPPLAPGEAIGGVPVLSGPQRLTAQDEALRDTLRSKPFTGPPRLVPDTR
ncbi:helix-turn-helix domain-containing protein [Streptomyces sp. NPDC006368]|uniref:helix-turn-helix domain-containing protein n=1 Tax=Streptomyces sp. NPDC006368 TaxID=3156760 RepID=UPI0033A2627F